MLFRSVVNTSDTFSAHQQQRRYFRSQGEMRCPRELFVIDLKLQLQEWLNKGDHIIVGLDANDDVRDSPVQKMLAELGLKEAILDMHPQDPPETNWRNSN